MALKTSRLWGKFFSNLGIFEDDYIKMEINIFLKNDTLTIGHAWTLIICVQFLNNRNYKGTIVGIFCEV